MRDWVALAFPALGVVVVVVISKIPVYLHHHLLPNA